MIPPLSNEARRQQLTKLLHDAQQLHDKVASALRELAATRQKYPGWNEASWQQNAHLLGVLDQRIAFLEEMLSGRKPPDAWIPSIPVHDEGDCEK